MYTTRRRMNDYKSFYALHHYNAGGVSSFELPMLVEGVYSWRTGQNAVSDPPLVPGSPGAESFGIQRPSGKGSLVKQLAERKRYIEEFQRSALPAETQTGSASVNRISATDTGHLFVSHKTLRQPYRGFLHRVVPGTSAGYYEGDVWEKVDEGVTNNSPFSLGLPGENAINALGLTQVQRQGVANRYFSSTAPDRNDAELAVTVIELLRGDLPTVLKNYRKMMGGYTKFRNYLGSEALNLTFGWAPLITEYLNLVKVGMTLDRAIYYESTRRKRQWDGPSVRNALPTSVTLSGLAGGIYNVAGMKPGYIVPPSSGTGMLFSQEGYVLESEDYHFTSRYSALAQPSSKANSFNDKAMEVIKRVGLVNDPELIWSLTPWSWLVDWFTTMGASISNAATYAPITGKYTIDYAYVTTQRTRSVSGSLTKLSTPPSNAVSYRVDLDKAFALSTTRWRDRATPFGFGTQLGSLSASQFAILVALGFAKTR